MGFNFKMQDDVEIEGASLGGGSFLWESGIYDCVVDMAYVETSKGGAQGIDLTLLNDEGKKLKQRIWVTNRAGDPTYVDKKTGKKRYLPGFSTVNNLCLAATGDDLDAIAEKAEEKTINVYDPEAKKEKPTAKTVLTALLGQKVRVAVRKQIVNKQVKVGDDYVNSAETREENEVVETAFMDTNLTVAERAKGVTEPAFMPQFEEKQTGVTVDRSKPADPRAANAGSGNATTAKPASTKKLFG